MARGHKARHGALALGLLLTVAVVGAAFGGASTAAPAAPAAAQKTELPMKTIGVMGPVDAAEIIKLSTDATIAAARSLGWKTVRVDPGGDPAKMASKIKPTGSPLTFRTEGLGRPAEVTLVPYYRIAHEHYNLYWRVVGV